MDNIPDYRCGRKTRHTVPEMLVCLIIGYCCGRTSVGRALEWCKNHISFLRKYMKLENGVASEATISRMLSKIDEKIFELEFISWADGFIKGRELQIIIDGKALRGATEKVKGGATPYILNAIEAGTQLVIGHYAIEEKTNEITAIPELLKLLEKEGVLFTTDAIGTQTKIMNDIVSGGGHFLLQVKRNQPTMYDDIMTAVAEIQKNNDERPQKPHSTWESQEKNRERIEYRECIASEDTEYLECVREGETPYIKSFGRIIQTRIPVERNEAGEDITVSKEEFLKRGSNRKPVVTEGDGTKDDILKIGVVSDLNLSAEEMAKYKRKHWYIENCLHHVLDEDFREDRSTATKSRNNLAVIRKYAYDLLRLAILKEHPDYGVQKMMDYFCDCPEVATRYIFFGIAY